MRDDWVFKIDVYDQAGSYSCWWYAYNEGDYWKLCDRADQSGFNTRYKRDSDPKNWINTVEWHYRKLPKMVCSVPANYKRVDMSCEPVYDGYSFIDEDDEEIYVKVDDDLVEIGNKNTEVAFTIYRHDIPKLVKALTLAYAHKE